MIRLFVCIYLMVCFLYKNLEACTTFLLKKDSNILVAKSYDWVAEDGLVVVNKRDVAKQAMVASQPLFWISRYGSIVFTQAGRELPMGGMNEKGLVVELMWLDGAAYPPADHRPAVNELQWIQYQLDTACCVDDVVASERILRISSVSNALLHFLVVDQKGDCVIIEFINGEMVVHRDSEIVTPVLTNDTYKESILFLKRHKGFGGELVAVNDGRSLNRFVTVATHLQQFSLQDTAADQQTAFAILKNVVNFEDVHERISDDNFFELNRSQWNIVYDIPNRKIAFLTANHQKVRTIHLDAFQFEGNTPVEVLDMQAKLSGDVQDHFVFYTYGINKELINRYYEKIPFLRGISQEDREQIARYPETTQYRPACSHDEFVVDSVGSISDRVPLLLTEEKQLEMR